jgi:drug/metabolite transporter (DMT)-like permease
VTIPQRVSTSAEPRARDTTALLLLVLLALVWGTSWPLMKLALLAVPPFSMRTSSSFLGSLTLIVLMPLFRRSFRIPDAKAWGHVFIASTLNITLFSIFTAFAQINAETSRVTILTYTMPIWACLMARPILGERLTATRILALALCIVGLAILIYPLAESGVPHGLLLAIATGVSWAAGTVYLKWARIAADPMGVATWQLIISFFAIGACVPIFEGSFDYSGAHGIALVGLLFTGIGGNGIAYGLWFEIVRRLPTMTASLGVLSVPVVGVVSSMLILGDRPTIADFTGFALIFAASVCVLLGPQPHARVDRMQDKGA